MKQAVIVSTARTGLAKSVRGGFNQTHGAVMGGHAVKHAPQRVQASSMSPMRPAKASSNPALFMDKQ